MTNTTTHIWRDADLNVVRKDDFVELEVSTNKADLTIVGHVDSITSTTLTVGGYCFTDDEVVGIEVKSSFLPDDLTGYEVKVKGYDAFDDYGWHYVRAQHGPHLWVTYASQTQGIVISVNEVVDYRKNEGVTEFNNSIWWMDN